ncbi:MAG: hypothetical protein HFI90_11210 [Clostridia bacterium]|nr:hypothetical protein [Clostridia bacterium]
METKALESVDLILGEAEEKTVRLDYDINGEVFCVNVKTALPAGEKYAFLKFIVDNCFVEGLDVSFNRDIAFSVAFWQAMTDLPLPTIFSEEQGKELVDVEKIVRGERALNLIQRCKQDACLKEVVQALEHDVDIALHKAFLENLFQKDKTIE